MEQGIQLQNVDPTQVQVLEGMTLAEAQKRASNIQNLDDPYEEEVRKVVLGDKYQPLSQPNQTIRTNTVSSDGLRTNLEVSIDERGNGTMEKATEANANLNVGETYFKAPNGKMYSLDDMVNVSALQAAMAKNDPNFPKLEEEARKDPPPTDKQGFTDWLLDHKIYVTAAIAALFLGWWCYKNFVKGDSAEVDMIDSAAAFCSGR